VKELVVSKSWWDTVDYLASIVGNTLTHEGMLDVMDDWIKVSTFISIGRHD